MATIIAFECSKCGEKYPPQSAPTICPKDGGPLYVRYDLAEIRRNTTRDAVHAGPKSMWRYCGGASRRRAGDAWRRIHPAAYQAANMPTCSSRTKV